MALERYSEVELEFGFEDQSISKLTVGPFATTDPRLNSLKAAIIQFNNDPHVFVGIVNRDGVDLSPNSPIKNATIVTTDKEVVL